MNKKVVCCENCIHKRVCHRLITNTDYEFKGFGCLEYCYDYTTTKDSVMLTREEYEKLLEQRKKARSEMKRFKRKYLYAKLEKDRLYERKLDLENQLTQRGLTEYVGADEIRQQARKETAREFMLLRCYITKQFHHYHEVRDIAVSKYEESKTKSDKTVANIDWHRADAIMFILENIGIEFDKIAKQFGVEIKE